MTESWIENNPPNPYCDLENYNFISNSRKIIKGCGLGLYIKHCYKFNLIDELTILNKKVSKLIFIKIQLADENLFCRNIYAASMWELVKHTCFIPSSSLCVDQGQVFKS